MKSNRAIRYLSEAEKAKICSLSALEVTKADIARRFSTGVSTVSKVLHENGKQRPARRHRKDITLADVLSERLKGNSITTISKRLHCSAKTVVRRLQLIGYQSEIRTKRRIQ